MRRQHVSSGAPWESVVGYCRAVRVGDTVHVAGTIAASEDGAIVSPDDAYSQALYALGKIERALGEAGATLADVVRTRMFVTDISQWEAIGRAHGEFFRNVRPAATMVQVAALIDPAALVEIEVDAVVQAPAAPRSHRYVGAYAAIERAGEALLTLKGRGPYTGMWDLAGGGIEHGEAPLDAVVREVQEETGLRVCSAALSHADAHRVTYTLPSGEREDLHHLGFIYTVQVDEDGDLLTTPDGLSSLGARWFSRAELAALPLTPFARRALQVK